MKRLSFSKLAFVCALALGIMASWSAAAPSAVNADSLIGGWDLYSGCAPCASPMTLDCPEGPLGGCDGDTFDGITDGLSEMSPNGGQACYGTGAPYCPDLRHSGYGC